MAANGTFTISGGEISSNTVSFSATSSKPGADASYYVQLNYAGGGVYLFSSSVLFVKTGGVIYGSNGPVIDGKDKRNLVKDATDNSVDTKAMRSMPFCSGIEIPPWKKATRWSTIPKTAYIAAGNPR
ncbi:MAG: hypothetical protein LBB98_02150 [Treponema sp.]|nr:hypothetical protein [Treponema sp.]